MRTKTVSKNGLWAFSGGLLAVGMVHLLLTGSTVMGILVGLGFVVLLSRIPELPLAIQINGTIIYFYALYKLGLQPETHKTAGFHILLISSYFLGGILHIKKRGGKLSLTPTDIFFAMFWILVFLSYSLFSTENAIAYKKISYAVPLVIAPYIGVRILSSYERLGNLLNYCIILPIIMLIPSFIELTDPIISEAGRFSPYIFKYGIDNPVLFGMTYGIVLLILTIQIFERKKLSLWLTIAAILTSFMLVRAGGRGPVLSLLIIIIILIPIIGPKGIKKKTIALFFVSILIVTAYQLIPEITKWVYISALQYRETGDVSVMSRISLQEAAIDDFINNPIFGVGFGNSAMGTGFPHNILIEVAAELGIVGVLVFLAMCLVTLKRTLSFIREPNPDLSLLAKLCIGLFGYSFFCALSSGHIANQTVFFSSIGLISALKKKKIVGSENLRLSEFSHGGTREITPTRH